MRCGMGKIFWIPLFLAAVVLSSAGPVQLKSQDVRKTMQEMLSLHVEYKDFNSLLARRSLKIYIEQFDPDRIYLLSDEVRSYIDPADSRLSSVIGQYQRDDLSEWKGLNNLIARSIERARSIRAELQKEIIAAKEISDPPLREGYVNYASSESDLKERIRAQLLRAIAIEQANSPGKQWTAEQRQKVMALWEKRFARVENPYLPNLFSGAQAEHYLAMHILKALAKSMDAHTAYFSPEEAYEMRTMLEKQFEGIGVVLREGIDGVAIHDMIKGGPAERSGKISRGDLLIDINGQSMANASYEEILKKLQGEGKSRVELGLKRQDASYYKVVLVREKIVMQEDRVKYSFEPYAGGIIGKLTLPSFYESGESNSCEYDMREALKALKKEGNLMGLVLDMRDNSGGFLNQAVKVAGLFVTSGVIVISKYAHGEVQYLRDLDGRSYYNGPLVILTSKASASAAEIVAQALQDYGTALVVGDERTYGKGTIQYQTVTDQQASTFFKVTVGRYYTVSGRTTQIDGVHADILVPTFYSAFNIGERYLEYPLKSDRIPSVYVDPLTDVDPRNQRWFKQNYLPNIQKKLSVWTQMLSQLKENTGYRIEKNRDFALFLKALDIEKTGKKFTLGPQDNFGVDDLQMAEAVNILKDMAIMNKAKPAPL